LQIIAEWYIPQSKCLRRAAPYEKLRGILCTNFYWHKLYMFAKSRSPQKYVNSFTDSQPLGLECLSSLHCALVLEE